MFEILGRKDHRMSEALGSKERRSKDYFSPERLFTSKMKDWQGSLCQYEKTVRFI